jgi:hypothetical protein
MVVVAAVFAWLVARSLVADGVAAGRRGGGGRGCRCGGSCLSRGWCGGCLGRWCGRWRRGCRCCRRTGRAGLGGGMREGRSWRRVRVVAGIIGDVADLSAMAGAPGSGRGHKMHGREAFARYMVPAPSASKLACLGRDAGLDCPDVDIARRGRSLAASMLGQFYGVREGRGPRCRCAGRGQFLVTASAGSAGNDSDEQDSADHEERDVAPTQTLAAMARRPRSRLSRVVVGWQLAHGPPLS